MPQLLALEWDTAEARAVVAATHGERVVIEQAFSVELRSAHPEEGAPEVDVGQRIAAALATRGIGRVDTVVAVGRSSIELRQLSLPPAPDNELPGLVRFQAMREFNELDEDWLLDFMPIDQQPGGTQTVLAAAIGPELVGQIERTCETAGLKPRRLILRPCGAASLLVRSRATGPAQPRLLVDLLAEEADLTVMIDRRLIFLRTMRLSGDPLSDADSAHSLLAEIRRTVAAAQNQLGGQQIGSIVLCGDDEQHAALAKQIEAALEAGTELFDPFSGLELGRQLRRSLPENRGRFAPLLGLALAELEHTPHAIDFLHPRRPTEPPRRYMKFILPAVAAVLVLALLFFWGRLQQSSLRTDIDRLTEDSQRCDKAISLAKTKSDAVSEINEWMATDVVWLNELRKLAQDFPPAKKAKLMQLTCIARTHNGQPGGVIELDGLAQDVPTIGLLEKGLRNQSREVEGTGSSELSPAPKYYSWKFQSSVFVGREQK